MDKGDKDKSKRREDSGVPEDLGARSKYPRSQQEQEDLERSDKELEEARRRLEQRLIEEHQKQKLSGVQRSPIQPRGPPSSPVITPLKATFGDPFEVVSETPTPTNPSRSDSPEDRAEQEEEENQDTEEGRDGDGNGEGDGNNDGLDVIEEVNDEEEEEGEEMGDQPAQEKLHSG